MKGVNMKKMLVVLMLGFLSGCEQPRVRRIEAERVPDSKVQELASSNWGKIEYAPGQYAGFAFDSSGVYGNLHGTEDTRVVRITFSRPRELPRAELFFSGVELSFVSDANTEDLAPRYHAPEGQFRWLGRPLARDLAYGRTFWISWKALGPGLPAPDGTLEVYVFAMWTDEAPGAAFRIDANSA